MHYHQDGKAQTVTAGLNITYHCALPTPGLVLAKAKLVRKHGRKSWAEAEIENGNGNVFASAKSLFVESRAKL